MSRVLLALALLALLPATAGARTIQQDLDAAHVYWGSTICMGQWQVTPDAPEQRTLRGGAATGLEFTWNGSGWDWHVARCEFTMDVQLQGCQRASVVRHEVGHFVHGPGHEGPMAPGAVDSAACPIVERALTRKASGRLRAKSARLKAKIRGKRLNRWGGSRR